MNRQYASRVLWGLCIVALGTGFLLNQFGVLNLDIGDLVSTFWPVFLMVAGLNGLLFARHGGGALWGCIMIFLGFIFLGRNLDWFDWSVGDIIRYFAPVVLILFGLNMIFRPNGKGRRYYEERDEWQSYKPGGYMPPAPPLHPDPTGVSGDNASAQQAGQPEGPSQSSHESQRFGPDLSKHEQYINMKHAMRQEHMEHRRRSFHKHSNPWERVEWWDHNPNAQTRSGFIGDIHIGNEHWELKPLNISHFIGDTVIDLTRAQIPPGETKITISSFIGDVKIYLPNDYEVGIHVVSSAFIGDARVLDMRDSRLFRSMDVETPAYRDTDKKIKLVCSTFIGDVRVTKVG